MLSLSDRVAMNHALTLPLRADIHTLLQRRIAQIFEAGLANHTHLVVVTAQDTEAALVEEVGFSPLEADGLRFDSPSFVPRVDVLHDHGGFFEWAVCTGNSGFAFVLLIEDQEGSNGLAELCRSILWATSANGYEGRRQ
ncbi:hypothetical protein [uncultured Sphingobium sp.]|uniref:hypothetical protein n=1 Tax=uncultured Sphingobium sp. TaxID=316087 RepID=UPI002584BCEE|nr:hypothetical protein [uncultured Sphingobium sp.]